MIVLPSFGSGEIAFHPVMAIGEVREEACKAKSITMGKLTFRAHQQLLGVIESLFPIGDHTNQHLQANEPL